MMGIGCVANARIGEAAEYIGKHLVRSEYSDETLEYLEAALESLRSADARVKNAIELEKSQ